jgi:asparagine synthase (glutamine-hydrolysing)
MCGIAGFLSRHPGHHDDLVDTVRAMTTAVAHRGPDDTGHWVDADAGIALGHRRLAITDRSPMGHQPMVSTCGRYVVACNGEFYNHLALRKGLGDQPWRGHSDTETLLACFTRYGVEATLPRLVGMFALAVWDRAARSLILARDRLGEKPLYWGHLHNGDLVFGSELAALRAHPRWQGEIDRDALALYARSNAVPAPYSIFRGIGKLCPGEWLAVSQHGSPRVQLYWDAVAVARTAHASPHGLDDVASIDTLETLLQDVVRDQMMGDVPVGAFLSGGIDSSLMVAMMCRSASQPVNTFTIGYREAEFNEAKFARKVAAHIGTRHTELVITAADALAVIPHLPRVHDEPFADASQIPTFLVSRLARSEVTVALTGDGGDELFAGYDRYLLTHRVWPRLQRIPLAMRRAAARAIIRVPPAAWSSAAGWLPSRNRLGDVGGGLHKFAQTILPARTHGDMVSSLMSHWPDAAKIVLGATGAAPLARLDRSSVPGFSDVEFMSLRDQLTYLPDDILVKVDRAAMSVGLETRAPLLDHRVVEFAWRTQMHQKMRHGQGKWLLRQLLHRYVPPGLVERPKQGFGVPLGRWLRGPLRSWAHELLDPAQLRRDGFFDADEVSRCWRQHLGGVRNWQTQIWNILMFQAWLHESPASVASSRPRWPAGSEGRR